VSLRWRLFSYLIGLHLLLFGFTVVLLSSRPVLFITAELLLLLSLAGGLALVRRALAPFETTARFRDLLQEQDYGARLSDAAAPELSELVQLFNTMLGTLYQERLALGEQRGFLDSLLEATPSAVVVFDFDANISLMNASACALLGLAEGRGKALSHWTRGAGTGSDKPGLLEQLDTLPLGQSRVLADAEGRRYRGQRGHFFDRGFARHFLVVEELTNELESSERAAYDKLIRVLAHEVNNTVAATGSVLDSLLFYSRQLSERDSADFCTAIDAVQRRNVSLGEFIERFTRVIKMPAPILRPNALGAMMDDILWLNREQCKSRAIDIVWTRRDTVAAVQLDRQLMEQALMNIVKNAMEAVQTGDQSGGQIQFQLVDEGERVRLSVIDSGASLGKAPAHALFTPFFSTKKGGQGIGLMFVREVLNRHGFAYRLAPNVQQETQFDIWFPKSN
jgi:nitrogen fixation/metabolism regulation signal transduction histidine kinase